MRLDRCCGDTAWNQLSLWRKDGETSHLNLELLASSANMWRAIWVGKSCRSNGCVVVFGREILGFPWAVWSRR